MDEFKLPASEIKHLRVQHRETKRKRDADRIKAIVLLSTGWTGAQVAEVLLMDVDTIKRYRTRYRDGGLHALLNDQYKTKQPNLNRKQLDELSAHLDAELYMTVQEIIDYIKRQYRIHYSVSGMTDLIHRLGFVYKKPKIVPGKAQAKAQEAFIERYAKIKENKGKNEPIYFMDGTHPQHNTMAAYGWIKRGSTKEIKSNTGRQRINMNGAIDISNLSTVIRMDESINAQSTLLLLKQIESKHANAEKVYIICDNARYYRSKLVKGYLANSKIELIFLPPYSPNLNLIERYWKFFKKKVLYNQYYPTFTEFKEACLGFFRKKKKYRQELKSLLAENFQIMGV